MFVIALLTFLVTTNNISDELQLYCSMFTNDAKMGGKATDIEIIESDLLETDDWAARNGTVVNSPKSLHLHTEPIHAR